MHGDVLVVEPDASVRDAVVAMTERQVSYALIRLPDGDLGIFTDRDLRTRVVAAGLSVDVPIAAVMSAPARSVTADLTAETVLMDMLECGLRHMPVVTARGEVVGVLEDADLLAASARQSFLLRRAIGAGRRRRGAAAGRTARPDAGRRPVPQRHQGLGDQRDRVGGDRQPGPKGVASWRCAETGERRVDGFAWLTLGSVARREAMPSSDVDSALSWRDDLDPAGRRTAGGGGAHPRDPRRLRPAVGQQRCGGLDADLRPVAVAVDRRGRTGWLDDPLRDRGLILSSLLIDGRVVWGDPALQHACPPPIGGCARTIPMRCGCNCSTRCPTGCGRGRCATCCRAAVARST